MQGRKRKVEEVAPFADIPDDILAVMIRHLDTVPDLLRLGQVSKRFQLAVSTEQLWEGLFIKRFGPPSKLHHAAHRLATSWLAFYRAKSITSKAADPWRKPCEFELQAAINDLANSPKTATGKNGIDRTSSSSSSGSVSSTGSAAKNNAAAAAAAAAEEGEVMAIDESGSEDHDDVIDDGLCVVFLVDGSGSVGEEDFSCMTNFLLTAAETISAVQHSKVCVVQFSNDTRVEVPLAAVDKPAYEAGIQNMVRMNGGTNIAAAVAKAGSLLKAEPASARRVLVLLTDGRIDTYQAREAGQMVAQLSDEQSNVGLWAFGVGRGVDAAELMRIIEGPGEVAKGLGRERYVELCVRDDAPW